LRMARSEATTAFGDGSVYLERYVEEPLHIEVQVLADAHGNVIHLGERECSIQRRHQKLIEECPSPFVTADMRAHMGEAACRVAKAAGYVNAGTIEFLVDRERNFYFLEMNTRLQVEHPVTEMVTGVDLVKAQIRVAEGHPLDIRQADVTWRGSAIECRINAEDPFAGWMPSPGRITGLRPASGPWTRDDTGAYEGATIPRYYDTLISKLIVWGEDRAAAIARMSRALHEYKVTGVRTTIPVLARIIDHEAFREGRLSTQLLERILPQLTPAAGRYESLAIIAAVLAEQQRLRDATGPQRVAASAAWRGGLRPGWRAGTR